VSSTLQNDGHIKPVTLQWRTSRETNPKGHWEQNYLFVEKILLFFLPGGPGMYVSGPSVVMMKMIQRTVNNKHYMVMMVMMVMMTMMCLIMMMVVMMKIF